MYLETDKHTQHNTHTVTKKKVHEFEREKEKINEWKGGSGGKRKGRGK